MAFGSSLETRTGSSDPIEPIYLKLVGERVIRILDKEEFTYWRYFMNVKAGDKENQGRSIVVARDNLIKPYMDRIGKEDRNWRGLQKRMLLNVLDRTPVKKNSAGATIYADDTGKFPAKDPNTGEDLNGVVAEPNNKVMVIDFGSELMQSFMTLHERVRHMKTFEPLPVWAFDLRIVTTTNPRDRKDVKRVVMPEQDQEPLPEELASLPKYDLSQLARPLPNEAQERLLNGEDYNTIMKELGWERPTPTVRQ